MIRYLLLFSLLTLSACQSNRLIELDYQPGHDYQAMQSWQWAEPAVQFVPNSAEQINDLDAERVRDAISAQFLQQGLRHSSNAPVQVRAWLITETQQQRTQVVHNNYWGSIWGPGLHAETYDTTFNTQKLQIDILDASNQQLIWRGSDSWTLPQRRISPQQRAATLQQHVQIILQHFPPH